MKTLIRKGFAALAAFGISVGIAQAADSNWTSTSGGQFNDSANWSAGVPGALDRANFTALGTYTVLFTNDVSAETVFWAASSLVTFDLGGFTFTRPNDNVNFDIDKDSHLTITNGVFNNSRQLNLAYNSSLTQTAGVTVTTGGVWNQINTNMYVGMNYKATFDVVNGGTLNTTMAALEGVVIGGTGANGNGTLTVSGTGSTWTNWNTANSLSRIVVSNGGTGTLTIANGGLVVQKGGRTLIGNSRSGYLNVLSGGVLDLTGAQPDAHFVIGQGASVNSLAIVSGAGSEIRLGATTQDFYLGNTAPVSGGSTGTLVIADQGKVTQNSRYAYVGNSGSGYIAVTNGGIFESFMPNTSQFYIGNASNSYGNVLVSGANSRLTLGSNVFRVASSFGSSGDMVIENSGSMTISNGVWVGFGGTGSMTVRDGGTLRTYYKGYLTVGYDEALGKQGNGFVMVTGATSRINIGDLGVGSRRGTGTLVIANGGTVDVYRQIQIGGSEAAGLAQGTLIVSGANSILHDVAPAADQDDSTGGLGKSFLGVGASTYSVADWDGTGLLTRDGSVRGKGAVIVENGGLVDISGRIAVFSNSSVRVDGGHTLSDQIGLESNSVFTAVLRLSDANSAQAMMTATNEVRLYGATLNVELGGDFVYNYGDTYRLIGFGTMSSSYRNLSDGAGSIYQDEDQIVVGGVTFDYSLDSIDPGYITLTAIPEPGSLGLIGAGIGLAALLRRRRKIA